MIFLNHHVFCGEYFRPRLCKNAGIDLAVI